MTNSSIDAPADGVRAVFPAMGNTARITVLGGGEELLEFARKRLGRLEDLWSRFVATSEVMQLNLANGEPVRVSPETVRLIEYMVGGWSATSGLFDPSMLGELVRAGYSRSLASSAITILPTGIEWAKDLGHISIDGDFVTLPHGLLLDPGGIGKGLAADIVAGELMDLGARGALVSIGGDIRCVGEGDVDGTWLIDIESPFDREPMCSIRLVEGAVATSCLDAKTFRDPASSSDDADQSHIMDPRTRTTVDWRSREIIQATVLARECVWAEVFTKAYLVLDASERIEFAAEHGLDAMVVHADGTTAASQGWRRFQR